MQSCNNCELHPLCKAKHFTDLCLYQDELFVFKKSDKKFEKSSDWISVKDRLPNLKVMNNVEKESDEVLLCLCGKEVIVGKLVVSNHNTHRYWKSSMGEYAYPFNNYVTHWQPFVLPKKQDY